MRTHTHVIAVYWIIGAPEGRIMHLQNLVRYLTHIAIEVYLANLKHLFGLTSFNMLNEMKH